MTHVMEQIIRAVLPYVCVTSLMRDMVIWPIGSRLNISWNTPVTLPNGLTFFSDSNDQLGRLLFFYGRATSYVWEQTTVRLLELLARNATGAFIAGGHLGYVALMARRALPCAARLLVCEPVPYLFDILSKNVAANSALGPVILEQRAVSDHEGIAQFTFDTLKSKISDQGTHTVSLTTIDALREKHHIPISLMLLDVEGAEADALHGASQTLPNVTDIIFEVSRRTMKETNSYERLRTLLSGYMLYRVEESPELVRVWPKRRRIVLTRLTVFDDTMFPSRYHNVLATKRAERDLCSLDSHLTIQVLS